MGFTFKWPIHCTNLGYKLVVMVWKTIWMFLMFIKLDNDTRKLKKYVKLRDIDILGSQNHVLYYFIRNMVFKWSILHQYWKQISFNCLENNLNVSHVKKGLISTPGSWPLGMSKSSFLETVKDSLLPVSLNNLVQGTTNNSLAVTIQCREEIILGMHRQWVWCKIKEQVNK